MEHRNLNLRCQFPRENMSPPTPLILEKVWNAVLTEADSGVVGSEVKLERYEESFTGLYMYKWKKIFYEMKGDVGMSLHEKERNKKMPTPRHNVTHNPIPTSLFCFNMLFVCLFVMNALGKANSKTS